MNVPITVPNRGDPISAETIRQIVETLRSFDITGPNVYSAGNKYHIRDKRRSSGTGSLIEIGFDAVLYNFTPVSSVRWNYGWKEIEYLGNGSCEIKTNGRSSTDIYGPAPTTNWQFASIVSPLPNSVLGSGSFIIGWVTGAQGDHWRIKIGPSIGNGSYHTSTLLTTTSASIPAGVNNPDGRPLYVRLESCLSDGSVLGFNDYMFSCENAIQNLAVNLREIANDATHVLGMGWDPSRTEYNDITLALQPSGGSGAYARPHLSVPVTLIQRTNKWGLPIHVFSDSNFVEATCPG